MPQSSAMLTPGHWDNRSKATEEERKFHIETASWSEPEIEFLAHWTDDEVLPLDSSKRLGRSSLGSAVRVAMQLAMLCVVLRIAASLWRGSVVGRSTGKCKRG